MHPTGYPTVNITVTGSSSRPLILVLASYEPAVWTLNIPTGVVIDKVLIVSSTLPIMSVHVMNCFVYCVLDRVPITQTASGCLEAKCCQWKMIWTTIVHMGVREHVNSYSISIGGLDLCPPSRVPTRLINGHSP